MNRKTDVPDAAVVTPPAAAQPATLPDAAAKAVDETLNNDGVLSLIQEKVPAELIIDHIRSAKTTSFDLSTSELIRLSKAGTPPAIIDQMRDPKRAAPPPVQAAIEVKAKPKEPQTTSVVVNDGTPFRITLTEAIRTDANIGLPLRFTAVEDFRVQGSLVFAQGAMVYGEITETPKKKKFLGIGNGKLSFSLSKVQIASGAWLNVRALAASRADGATQRPVETGGKLSSKDIAAIQGTGYIAYIDSTQNAVVPAK